MPPLSNRHPFRCVTCELEITGRAVFHVGLPFCCAGCVAGGPCTCSYDEEAIDHDRTGRPAVTANRALAHDARGLAAARR